MTRPNSPQALAERASAKAAAERLEKREALLRQKKRQLIALQVARDSRGSLAQQLFSAIVEGALRRTERAASGDAQIGQTRSRIREALQRLRLLLADLETQTQQTQPRKGRRSRR